MAPRVGLVIWLLVNECGGFAVRRDPYHRVVEGWTAAGTIPRVVRGLPVGLRLEVHGDRSRRTVRAASAAGFEVQYGDTAGAALVVRNTMLSRGSADILSDVNWRVMPNEHWAIVGPNGERRLCGVYINSFK